MIWFGLVGFYGISTIVGYLMPNPLYTYILNKKIKKSFNPLIAAAMCLLVPLLSFYKG